MRENAFAFRRFREYEQICSCWQGFKEMRIQGIVLLQAAPEKEVMITKQESKNLSYEDYQDFFARRKVLSKNGRIRSGTAITRYGIRHAIAGFKKNLCDMIRKMIPLGGGDLHGNWEQTVTGIWLFKMTGGSYAKTRWGRGGHGGRPEGSTVQKENRVPHDRKGGVTR